MSEQQDQNEFSVFKNQYGEILENFLNDKKASEIYLNEGYKLGRDALINHISILDVAAIHYDCLITYLENLESNEHIIVSEKANAYFEEILASFQMTEIPFREAITLLNRRSLAFAGKVRALQDSLKEKEALLKEVYHRVKNNLQVVTSLLNLQAEAAQDPIVQKSLTESSARVKSMALIHEMLYQTEDLSSIDMKSYSNNLLKYLFEIYDVDVNKITLATDIDNIVLSIDTAIPCGLIINELISNALKYAFLEGKSGGIKFALKEKENNIILIISDDSSGISSRIDINNTPSLGMRLVHSLTKQLGGEIALQSGKGTTFKLTFPG